METRNVYPKKDALTFLLVMSVLIENTQQLLALCWAGESHYEHCPNCKLDHTHCESLSLLASPLAIG